MKMSESEEQIEIKAKVEDKLWPFVLSKSTPLRESEEVLSNYPSSAEKWLSCLLRCYFDRTDKVDEDFSALAITFAHGNAIHSTLIDMFKKAGIWRGDEVRGSNKEFNVSYRIDALIEDPASNLRPPNIVPVEIKSVNARSWAISKTTPFPSHYLQLQLYMHFHKPAPYPYGYLLYFNKNTDEVRTYKVNYDRDICVRMENALKELEWRVSALEQPEPPESTEPCRWCQYKFRCFEGGD
jgi:CRISPR/Cas system-associated exonuclease Cas4 (RecB family)